MWTAMRPQGGWPDRKVGRRRRGTKPGSARSQHAACEAPATREEDPPNVRVRLTRAATKGGKEGGDPHREGEKGREKLLRGVWYSLYGKLSKPTGPRDGRAVLQLHPALDLLHHGPVRKGVQMQKRREAVHRVLLLG